MAAGASRTSVAAPACRAPPRAAGGATRARAPRAASTLSRKRRRRRWAVDPSARALDRLQHGGEPLGLQHEFLEALHRHIGEILAGVAIEELRHPVGALEQRAPFHEESILDDRSLAVDRNLQHRAIERLL